MPQTRKNYDFLDGIRGLAALLVVLYHAYLFTGSTGEIAAEMPWVKLLIGWGYLGVPVFIVVSGFVLMLPLRREHGYVFKRGLLSFFKRRAKRILPPYWAALLLTLVLIWSVPIMQRRAGTQWDTKLPVTPENVVAHLFLIHDFSPEWIGRINGPMWSVAVEWHIYFLMPLVLIPLWRRLARSVVVLLTAVATVSIPVGLGIGTFAHPWLVLCFVFGMLAADAVNGRPLRRSEWVVILSGMTAIIAVTVFLDPVGPRIGSSWLTETIAGGATATGVGLLAHGRGGWVAGVLSSRVAMFAGLVSYSVYLVHSPLLALGNLVTLGLPLSTGARYAVMTLAVAPLSIAAAIAFFYVIERHFLNTHQKKVAQSLEADSPSDADRKARNA